MPLAPERRERLTQFLKGALQRVKAGEIDTLPTYGELAQQFGYKSDSGVGHVIISSGLADEVRSAKGIVVVPPRPHIVKALTDFAEDEVRRFRLGEIDRVSSHLELAGRFAYASQSSVQGVLKRRGLHVLRREAQREVAERIIELTPSEDLAWILGLLSAGGTVDEKRGAILLATDNTELHNKFRRMGENIFEVSAKSRRYKLRNRSKEYERNYTEFANVRAARALGDLRIDRWWQTIHGQHTWILNDTKYIWRFIEGFFEMRGSVFIYRQRNKYQISLGVYSRDSSNYLADMMIRAGVKNPSIGYKGGVKLHNLDDIKFFVRNVRSVDSERQKKLTECLEAEKRKPSLPTPQEDLLAEWTRITQHLGHTPTSTEIRRFRQQGKTKFSVKPYSNQFGERSFPQARSNLEIIVFVRETNRQLDEASDVIGEVNYTPKVHRDPEDETKRKVEEILAPDELLTMPSALIRTDGTPLVLSQQQLNYLAEKSLTPAERLARHVREEITMYDFGETRTISTIRQLQHMFGFTGRGGRDEVFSILDSAGLRESRNSVAKRRKRTNIFRQNRIKDEELINEWINIRNNLGGRPPSESELNRLRSQKKTKYSLSTYVRHFGKGRFSVAVGHLERIAKERAQKLLSGKEAQIFP